MNYIDLLVEYGLTRQEAVIYIELMRHGAMTGYEVSKETGISKSNVYAALKGLTQKGAANLEEASASRYHPVDIKEFCDNGIRHLNKLKEELVSHRPEKIVRQEGYINIQSERHIRDKIYNMLGRCELRLYILAHDWLLEEYREELERLIKAGRKVVVLTDDDIKFDGATVYKTDVEEGQLRFIVDSAYVLTGQLRGGGEETCLYSEQTNLVEVMKEALRYKIVLIKKGIDIPDRQE